MKRVAINKILRKGKALYLAYDQGIEHGPVDFNDKNADPKFIIDVAEKGKFAAVIFQKGIAEKYRHEIKKSKVPLILKLNGRTNLVKGEPLSAQIATVAEARALGAVAVGFTIYIGSSHEAKMIEQFEKIECEAHKIGMPVIAWIYPRGEGTKNRPQKELLAYAARVALELGADIAKIHWSSAIEDLRWAVKAAGKTKIVVAGGTRKNEREFLELARKAMEAGCVGLAVGRNVWQAEKPLEVAKKLREIIFGD